MSTERHDTEPDLTEFADLVVALERDRPAPTPEFAERMDRAVADHFPKEWSDEARKDRGGLMGSIGRWFDGLREYRLPAMAGVAGLVVVVAVIGVGLNQGPGEDGTSSTSENSTTMTDSGGGGAGSSAESAAPTTEQAPAPVEDGRTGAYVGPKSSEESTDGTSSGGMGTSGGGDSNYQADSVEPFAGKTPGPVGPNAAGVEDRMVAHETDITLGTEPESVQDVSNEIVETVDEHDGIVLDSEVVDGEAGRAGAEFSLMIPSDRLDSAVADLSGIADLRARTQETEDITAPTLTGQDKLQDARAEVQSLVKELSEATTDEDRTRIEGELDEARFRAANLTTRLNKLERRANLTPVGVTVETGGDTSSGDEDPSWGIGDAADDAGRLFGIAAGVALIALAVAIPIAVLVLIALALNRAWVRRARRRALDEN